MVGASNLSIEARMNTQFDKDDSMKGKIMIVDDEDHIRTLYSQELDDEGYQVVTLSNGYKIL